jgi:hypothetical protein
MNPATVAEWYRRQGYHVVRTRSSYWYNSGPRVFQAFPWNWMIEPSREELCELFREHSAIGIRFSTLPASQEGVLSYHTICDDKSYDIRMLSRQTRQNVKRGLEHCVVRRIPFHRLAHDGWNLHCSTLKRQGRRDLQTKHGWQRRCFLADELPGFEVWGALVGHALAAALLLVRIDDWVVLLSQESESQLLHHRPNHALVYTVTKELMSRTDVGGVFYTLKSLDAPASVDEFKFRMGYRAALVKQRAAFHPRVAHLVNQHLMELLRGIHNLSPSSPVLAKAEGMVRMHIDGKRPIGEQQLPVALKHVPVELLEQFL